MKKFFAFATLVVLVTSCAAPGTSLMGLPAGKAAPARNNGGTGVSGGTGVTGGTIRN